MSQLAERMPTPRECIQALENEMLKMPQVEIIPRHYFIGGLCAREITIPAGTLLTGKIHLEDHLNFVSGDISVETDEGMTRLTGVQIAVPSKKGIKRAGYAHADTIWTTVHATPAKTPEEAEMLLVVDSFEKYLEVQKCLG